MNNYWLLQTFDDERRMREMVEENEKERRKKKLYMRKWRKTHNGKLKKVV